MTSDEEPRRWIDDDADELLSRLSRAARADGPSARALRAAPVAVAALVLASAPTVATAAEAASTASALAAKSTLSPLVLAKWVTIGALGSSSALALSHAPELLRSAPAVTAHQAVATNPQPIAPRAPRFVASAPPAFAPEPAVTLDAEVAAAPSPTTDVAREVALLDAARAALVAGDAERALRSLRTLERLPARSLVPEATVLQVRALLANGRSVEARDVATRFLKNTPSAPQANVLRSLIANSEIQP